MNSIVCPNCGAAIYENEAKCPFCGYINITGAEEKFMRDMKKTESDMSQIPELQKAEYKKSMSKNSKIIFITMGIVAFIAAILFGIHMFFEHVLFSYNDPYAKEEMLWEHETFPLLDEMYEAGDYDGILEFENELYEQDSKFYIFDWEHYYFILVYGRYKDAQYYVSLLDQGEKLTDHEAENIVYDCVWFHYREYATSSSMLYTEEEIAQIDEWRKEMEVYLFERLKFTQEELDTLYEDVREEDGSIDYKACRKYGKKIADRIK